MSSKIKFIRVVLLIFLVAIFGFSQSSFAKKTSQKQWSPIGTDFERSESGRKYYFKIQVRGKVVGKKFKVDKLKYIQEREAGNKSNIRFYRKGTSGKKKKNFIVETPDSLGIGKYTGSDWDDRRWRGVLPAGKRVCATFVRDVFFIDLENYWACFRVPS